AQPPIVHGLVIEGVGSARAALAPLLEASGMSVADDPDGLSVGRNTGRAPLAITDVVAEDGPREARRRGDPSEAVGRVALSFADRDRDYLGGSVTALREADAPI